MTLESRQDKKWNKILLGGFPMERILQPEKSTIIQDKVTYLKGDAKHIPKENNNTLYELREWCEINSRFLFQAFMNQFP